MPSVSKRVYIFTLPGAGANRPGHSALPLKITKNVANGYSSFPLIAMWNSSGPFGQFCHTFRTPHREGARGKKTDAKQRSFLLKVLTQVVGMYPPMYASWRPRERERLPGSCSLAMLCTMHSLEQGPSTQRPMMWP